ncbi:hypothetical protein ACFY36_18490 [Actinoplanes sp. NPDC000266]
MAAVTRVLPRHWDGRRLLRFLTGLAMLALAFTVPATPPVAPAAPVAFVSSVRAEAATRAPTATLVADPAPAPPVTVPALIAATVIVLLAGVALRVRPVRGPPAL